MTHSCTEDFIKELGYCKNIDLQQVQIALRRQVKEYFPLNGVPAHIVEYLDILQDMIEISEEMIVVTVDNIIEEIEKDLP